MKCEIDSSVLDLFPEVRVGIIAVNGLDNTKLSSELTELLREEEKNLRGKPDFDPIQGHPRIACWREAHKKFGSRPKKHPPSVEALVRRVLKRGDLPEISPLVDAYNIISLRHLLTAGGEDLDQCEGNVKLALARGDEEFIALGETENRPPKEGEVIYRDWKGVICRRWNWREGDRTKLTSDTKNAILVLEALPPVEELELETALKELSELVQKFCGGELTQYVLHSGNPEVELPGT